MSTYITLAEAKAHLRIDFDDDDTYIQSLCDLAETVVLDQVRGGLVGDGTVTTNGTTTLIGSLTKFTDYNVGDSIKVDGETIRTIATITDDETLTVTEAFTTSDNYLTYTMYEGFALVDDELPLPLKHAMLLAVANFYMNRETMIIGASINELPMSFKYLIAPYKHWVIR